jgi:hypothetical protein
MKFIIILIIVLYLLSKIGSIFFRAGVASQRGKNYQERRPNGSVHVDSVPKKQKRGNIKGGDYVDYEEVK